MALVFVLVQGRRPAGARPRSSPPPSRRSCCWAPSPRSSARGGDPLMPPRLLRSRSLLVAMGVTGLFLATFGALPYFLTILFQQVQGMTPLQSGLAFLVPSLSIAAGTQLGERLTTRVGARATLAAGFAIGIPGHRAAGARLLARRLLRDGGAGAGGLGRRPGDRLDGDVDRRQRGRRGARAGRRLRDGVDELQRRQRRRDRAAGARWPTAASTAGPARRCGSRPPTAAAPPSSSRRRRWRSGSRSPGRCRGGARRALRSLRAARAGARPRRSRAAAAAPATTSSRRSAGMPASRSRSRRQQGREGAVDRGRRRRRSARSARRGRRRDRPRARRRPRAVSAFSRFVVAAGEASETVVSAPGFCGPPARRSALSRSNSPRVRPRSASTSSLRLSGQRRRPQQAADDRDRREVGVGADRAPRLLRSRRRHQRPAADRPRRRPGLSEQSPWSGSLLVN